MNTMILVGHLGMDPEIKRFDGKEYVNVSFSVADNYRTKDKETGEWVDAVTWYTVRKGCGPKEAEYLSSHLRKGDRVTVVGTHRPQTYVTPEGKTVHTSVVTAMKLERMNDSKKKDDYKSKALPREDMQDEIPF